MPNFSSLARLEVPEKFVWGVGWGGLHSHFRVKPNRCVVLCWGWGWGFDNRDIIKVKKKFEGIPVLESKSLLCESCLQCNFIAQRTKITISE